MCNCFRSSLSMLLVVASLSAFASSVQAQGRGGGAGLFGPISTLALTQLDEVKSALKLTAEQNKEFAALNEKFSSDRREAFQSAGDDRAAATAKLTKLTEEATAKLNAKLNEAQIKRLSELYVQVNGASVLLDAAVMKSLNITDAQKSKLEAARDDSRSKMREAFQDYQNMSQEERAKKFAEFTKARDDSYLTVLTADQKVAFEKSKGEKLEIDLSKLPRPGRQN